MRPSQTQPNPMQTYAQHRCAHTRHMRKRAQRAEAEAAALRAEVAALRQERRDERAALAAHIESPEWARDLLLIARDRVRGELINLSARHASCGTCGSFGRGFSKNFLTAEIDRLSTAHALPSVPPLPDPDWPVQMGLRFRGGQGLDTSWLMEAPKRRQPDRTGLSW